jgi:hypothetical protein
MTTELPDDDRPPLDPAESLRLIERERAEAARQLIPDPRLLYWPWGVAWLVGFGLLFLRFGPDDTVYVDMPSWLPLTTMFTLLIGAGIVSGVGGARAARHVSGPSSVQGAMYGTSFFLGFAGLAVTISRVSDQLPDAFAGLLWGAASVGLVGALHMAGGALWSDRHLFGLGVWVSIINIVGVLAGPGWHSLVVSLAGGGGMLLVGALAWASQHGRRSR